MALSSSNNSGDFAHVLHGIFEKHKGHDSVQFIVLSQSQVTHVTELFRVLELLVELVIKGLSELGEH